MAEFLSIKARLPRQAGLELSARLTAARPQWDIEADDDGLSFIIPLIHGRVDDDLTVLEEACRNLERQRADVQVELDIARVYEKPARPAPAGVGPWRIKIAANDDAPKLSAENERSLIIPDGLTASQRLWAGESLMLTALADHLTPPPGAPETRHKPALIMEAALPLAPIAAHLAGAGPISVIIEEEDAPVLAELLAANSLGAGKVMGQLSPVPAETVEAPTMCDGASPLRGVEIITAPFKSLARKKPDWAGHFGLIAVHLSPYLTARRFKTLAAWLEPGGAIVVSGFAPGPHTAHLLRSAAKAGLCLAGSVNEDDWAAMRLEKNPIREELPPLTGSVVPDLMELPPESEKPSDEEAAEEPMPGDEAEADEIADEESIIIIEEEDDEE